MNKRLLNTLYYCAGIILFAIILQLLSIIINKEVFFPGILNILKAFGKLLITSKTYIYIFNTILDLLLALLISFIIGILLAVLANNIRPIYKILKPIMIVFRCFPIVIIFVLLMVVLKLKYVALVSTVLVLIPLIYEATYQGLISINKDLLDVYKINSNLSIRIIFNVHLPLVSSHSKEAYINSLGMAIKILITTEYLSGKDYVIGRAILNSFYSSEHDKIFAYSFILVILVIILELIPVLLHYIFIKIKTKKDNDFIEYMLKG